MVTTQLQIQQQTIQGAEYIQQQRQQLEQAKQQAQQQQIRQPQTQRQLRQQNISSMARIQGQEAQRFREQQQALAKIGSTETQFEQEIARNMPEYAKEQYLEPIYQEVIAEVQPKIEVLKSEINQFKQALERARASGDSERRDYFEERIQEVQARLGPYEAILTAPKVEAVKQYLSGQTSAMSQYEGNVMGMSFLKPEQTKSYISGVQVGESFYPTENLMFRPKGSTGQEVVMVSKTGKISVESPALQKSFGSYEGYSKEIDTYNKNLSNQTFIAPTTQSQLRGELTAEQFKNLSLPEATMIGASMTQEQARNLMRFATPRTINERATTWFNRISAPPTKQEIPFGWDPRKEQGFSFFRPADYLSEKITPYLAKKYPETMTRIEAGLNRPAKVRSFDVQSIIRGKPTLKETYGPSFKDAIPFLSPIKNIFQSAPAIMFLSPVLETGAVAKGTRTAQEVVVEQAPKKDVETYAQMFENLFKKEGKEGVEKNLKELADKVKTSGNKEKAKGLGQFLKVLSDRQILKSEFYYNYETGELLFLKPTAQQIKNPFFKTTQDILKPQGIKEQLEAINKIKSIKIKPVSLDEFKYSVPKPTITKTIKAKLEPKTTLDQEIQRQIFQQLENIPRMKRVGGILSFAEGVRSETNIKPEQYNKQVFWLGKTSKTKAQEPNLMFRERTKTALASIPRINTRTRTDISSQSKTKVEQGIKNAVDILSGLKVSTAQKTDLRTQQRTQQRQKMPEPQIPKFRQPTPRIPEPRIPRFKIGYLWGRPRRTAPITKKIQPKPSLFVAELRRRGKFKQVSRPLPFFEASKEGKRSALSNLGVSVRLRELGSGRVVSPMPDQYFRPLKKGVGIAQKRGLRLSSKGERIEIEASRRYKKINFF